MNTKQKPAGEGGQNVCSIMKFPVYDMLPVGMANKIPGKKLASLCGYKTTRELQQAISIERLAGAYICSTSQNGGGYFKHTSYAELKHYVTNSRNRALNTLKALSPAYKELKRIEAENEAGEADQSNSTR